MFVLAVAVATAIAAFSFSQVAASQPPSQPSGTPAGKIPGRYIVVLKQGVAPGAVAKKHGVAPDVAYKSALNGFAAPASAKQAKGLAKDPRVLSVEPDRVVRALAQTVPTGVDRIDVDENGTAAIANDGGNVPVTVAVIDTGIDLDHPDLNVASGLGTTCASGKKTPDDQNGHGSHVAGSIAALDDNSGVVGVAPGAAVVPVRVLGPNGSGSLSCIVEGIDHVTAAAGQIAVANMSLGWQGNSPAARTAIQNSVAAGIVYTVAAGNDGDDVYGSGGFGTGDEYEPASYPETAAISALADSDGTSGGSGSGTSYGPDDSFATFSNYSSSVVVGNPVSSPGAAVDLILPGVDILSTYKDGGYATISGTSMASPHAAGLAALYIADNGHATDATGVAAIRQALIDAGRDQTSDLRLAADHVDTEPDSNKENLGWAGSASTNSAPAATPGSAPVTEDGSVEITLTGSDPETCELTFSVVSGPANGNLSAPGGQPCASGTPNTDTATVTYTPNGNFNGTDSFTYKVTDGDGAFDEATVTITVNEVNDAPTAAAVDLTTDEDTQGSWDLDVNDVEGDALTCSIATPPTNGTATVASDCLGGTYDPAADYNGTDSFTYKVTDSDGASDTATVSVTVTSVTDAPVASNDSASTDVDTPVSLNVLANDTDADGDALSIGSYDATGGGGGSVSCDTGTGDCTYTPTSGFSGSDSFGYTAVDGNGGTDTATVTIGVSSPPTATGRSATVAEDGSVEITLTGSDPETCELGFSIVSGSGPTDGSLGEITGQTCTTGSPNAGSAKVTYTPDPDFYGKDSFDFRVTDGDGAFDEATVTIDVTPVNDAPTADDVPDVTTDEDTPGNWTPDVSDPDAGDTLTCSIATQPASGTATVAADCSGGTYDPDEHFNADDSFTYAVSDGDGASGTATVSVTVTSVNDAPVANNDSASTDVDTPVTVNVLANDTDVDDSDTLSISSYNATSVNGGSVSCTGTGDCTYTPTSGFSGTDSFGYTASDSSGGSDTATVTIGVQSAGPAFSEDFESGATGWTASGFWHLADDTGCVTPGSTSGTHSFYFGDESGGKSNCTYEDRRKRVAGALTSPSIDVSGASSVTLGFQSWREVELYTAGAFDRTWVEVSYDGGASWTTVWERDSRDSSSPGWTSVVSETLSPAGTSMQVRFLFDTLDGVSNDYTGWLIDDVTVN